MRTKTLRWFLSEPDVIPYMLSWTDTLHHDWAEKVYPYQKAIYLYNVFSVDMRPDGDNVATCVS